MLPRRSGSGKTTLLKFINGMFFLRVGRFSSRAAPPPVWDPIHLRVPSDTLFFQEVVLFLISLLRSNVLPCPTLERWDSIRIAARVEELLHLVGLNPASSPPTSPELSGGQQQRVGVARGLAADPPILHGPAVRRGRPVTRAGCRTT